MDQEINLRRLAEYRKLRSDYNRVKLKRELKKLKRAKKRERQMKINKEIKRANGVNNPREFWSAVKCSIQGPGLIGDVPPVEMLQDNF